MSLPPSTIHLNGGRWDTPQTFARCSGDQNQLHPSHLSVKPFTLQKQLFKVEIASNHEAYHL